MLYCLNYHNILFINIRCKSHKLTDLSIAVQYDSNCFLSYLECMYFN